MAALTELQAGDFATVVKKYQWPKAGLTGREVKGGRAISFISF
ncbi:hypothetical protein [Dyella subtropica]|nr:hypothetical protein [Dyella subtropica]